ncbi:hypothetical protein BM86_07625, partial [Bacillus thuringiensis]|nr:hypothetical protein [Bacillus thuringiensis]
LLSAASYIALEVEGTKHCLHLSRGDKPPTLLLAALWEAEKELTFDSALTAYREPLIQRPEAQFPSSRDQAALELLL